MCWSHVVIVRHVFLFQNCVESLLETVVSVSVDYPVDLPANVAYGGPEVFLSNSFLPQA